MTILPKTPERLKLPTRLFVETTTRCNMQCAMCVKHAEGSCIPEEDMAWDIFETIGPALSGCEAVVLNGIGEPLLHPRLPDMVRFCRERMPDESWVGFQTNGLLLTPTLARKVADAGVDTVCLSVDSVRKTGAELHGGRHLERVERGFSLLRQAGEGRERPLRLGAEFVFMRDTCDQLEDVVRWVAAQGGEYLLVTHMLPYEGSLTDQSLFNPNTPKATAIFRRWQDQALSEGLNLHDFHGLLAKFIKTPQEKRLEELYRKMGEDADAQGVWVHLRYQLEWDKRDTRPAEEAVARAEDAAAELGVELHMPPLLAEDERRCHFVEHNSAFITPDGAVAPCHFLWHRFSCHLDGKRKNVEPWIFGSLADESLETIWNSTDFEAFRGEVLQYEYPYCSNCNFVPCQDISCESHPFEADCLAGKVPCGHCLWCMGGLQCLM